MGIGGKLQLAVMAASFGAVCGCSGNDSSGNSNSKGKAGAGETAGVSGVKGGGSGGKGTAGTSAAGIGATPTASQPTTLPTAKGTCEPFVTGDMMFSGQKVKIWAGTPAHGPLVIYWYATGSSVAEVTRGLGMAAIDEITGMGGVVAAMYATTKMGTNTGNGVWYTGDFDVADEVVACAIEMQHIDTEHIHALGFSAGGLQTGYMAYARSSYIASVVTYSGGTLSSMLQDPDNVPAVMCQHGDMGADVVILDFATMSMALETDIQMRGSFAIDCHHPGGHLIPSADVGASWQFLKDHPYKVGPEPYAMGIPSTFPGYCTIP